MTKRCTEVLPKKQTRVVIVVKSRTHTHRVALENENIFHLDEPIQYLRSVKFIISSGTKACKRDDGGARFDRRKHTSKRKSARDFRFEIENYFFTCHLTYMLEIKIGSL